MFHDVGDYPSFIFSTYRQPMQSITHLLQLTSWSSTDKRVHRAQNYRYRVLHGRHRSCAAWHSTRRRTGSYSRHICQLSPHPWPSVIILANRRISFWRVGSNAACSDGHRLSYQRRKGRCFLRLSSQWVRIMRARRTRFCFWAEPFDWFCVCWNWCAAYMFAQT